MATSRRDGGGLETAINKNAQKERGDQERIVESRLWLWKRSGHTPVARTHTSSL